MYIIISDFVLLLAARKCVIYKIRISAIYSVDANNFFFSYFFQPYYFQEATGYLNPKGFHILFGFWVAEVFFTLQCIDSSLIDFSITIISFDVEALFSENSTWNFATYNRGYETQR